MGDAGPPTPPPGLAHGARLADAVEAHPAPLREVKVLVTGFGPFKSFLINPSWLITSALPDELDPEPTSPDSFPSASSSSSSPPYKIKLITHPSPIRVSYSTVSTVVPELLAQHDPDFVLHIGMAGGRDCYTLETRAHRDGYRIKDVDDNDGFSCGEVAWKREGVPDCLLVAWDEDEVLARWEKGVERGLVKRERELVHSSGSSDVPPVPLPRGFSSPMKTVWGTVAGSSSAMAKVEENRKRGVVKLSRDAGRFLCEYALFESLSRRWVDANKYKSPPESQQAEQQRPLSSASPPSPSSNTGNSDVESKHSKRHLALERLGKVAFLHVPGWTGAEDVTRGAMVAEEVIRALVSSWEDGYRRDHKARTGNVMGSKTAVAAAKSKFTDQNSEVDTGRITVAREVGVGIEDLQRVQWRA